MMDRDDAAARQDSDGDADDLFDRFKKWFKEDKPHCEAWHKDAREDFDFVAGHQWSEEDKSKLTASGRVPLVMNRAGTIIDSVIGSEVANRQEVRFLPRTTDDGPVDDILTEAGRWFRDECDAEHEESNAFSDMVQAGMGWTETRLDYEENSDGDPRIERISPFEMYWDHAARKANLTDKRRVWRVRGDVPIEEARALFPDAEDEDLHASWAKDADDEHGDDLEDVTRPRYSKDGDGEYDSTPDLVTIVQVQWFEREPFYRAAITAMDEMGQPQTVQKELSEDEHKIMSERAPKAGLRYRAVKQVRKCYYQAFVGAKVLDEPTKMQGPSGKPAPGFSFKAITGKLDQTHGQFYGLVRAMKDPQRYANKWLSQALHIINTSAKGGLWAEVGAFEDPRQAEADYARPDAITFLKNGALSANKIKEKPQAQFPAAFMQMTEFAISGIRDTTGVNAEVLGMREADQAASLEAQRTKAATTILQPLFDSLRRYRKLQGRYLLYLITEFLSDGRLVRIAGEEAAQYVPLLRQPETVSYDVIVDEAATSANQKEQIWMMLMQLLPAIKDQLPPQMMLALLKYSPLPASAVAEITQAASQVAQAPEAQAQKQLALQGAQADVAHKQAQADKASADAQHKRVLAYREATGANDPQGEAGPNELEVMQGIADIDKTRAETDKIRADTHATEVGAEVQTLGAVKTVSDVALAHAQHGMQREAQAHSQGMDQAQFAAGERQAAHSQSMDKAGLVAKAGAPAKSGPAKGGGSAGGSEGAMLARVLKLLTGGGDEEVDAIKPALQEQSAKLDQLSQGIGQLLAVAQAPTEIHRDPQTGAILGARKVMPS